MNTLVLCVWTALFFYTVGKARGRRLQFKRLPDQLRLLKRLIDDGLRQSMGVKDYGLHIHVGREAFNCESTQDAARLSVSIGAVLEHVVPIEASHEKKG